MVTIEPEHTGWTIPTLKVLMDERFDALETALRLQASEYERRLNALNHAHDKAVEVQHTYVTQDKYEDRIKSDQLAMTIALERVNEKFDEYVKRYEIRQREIDQALAISKGAAEQSQRISEEQGRKNNRNIAITGVVLTGVVALANFIPSIIPG